MFGCGKENPDMATGELADQGSTAVVETEAPIIEILETDDRSPFGDISLEYLNSIGSDREEGYVFSIIKGIVVDSTGALIVLDSQMMEVRIFSSEGDLIRVRKLDSGEGPGEFQWPMGMALSGNENYLYIFDQGRRTITVLNRNLEYLHSFEAPTNYAYMTTGSQGNEIIATFNQMDIRDRPLIRSFDEAGREISAYGGKHDDFAANLAANLQYFYLTFIARRDNQIFLSYAYPYDIHVFDDNGLLARRIKRAPPFFGDTYVKGDFVFPTGACMSLIAAGESLLLHFLYDTRKDVTYIEAIDYLGRKRGLFDMKERGYDALTYSFPQAVSRDGIVYIVAEKPYPRILAFRITVLPV
jgi:hypothetical protein